MTGYHANDKQRCTKFIDNPDYLIIDDSDTDFLGKGMYFWEHESRAEWWLSEKHKEVIVKAELNLSNMLDLTDEEKLGYIKSVADKFNSAMTRKGIKPEQIGLKLNYLFESYKLLSDTYTSIKAHFYYKKLAESDFLYGSKLTAKCVDIYTVRDNPSLVTKRQWVKK